jgi:hypothetical protein
MYSLIENETKNLMVANGRIEYAFAIVDQAVPPEIKAGPHRLINTLVGLIVGFGAGAVMAAGLDWLRRWRGGDRPAADSLQTVSAARS